MRRGWWNEEAGPIETHKGWSYMIGRSDTHGRNEDEAGEIESCKIESEGKTIIHHEMEHTQKCFSHLAQVFA